MKKDTKIKIPATPKKATKTKEEKVAPKDTTPPKSKKDTTELPIKELKSALTDISKNNAAVLKEEKQQTSSLKQMTAAVGEIPEKIAEIITSSISTPKRKRPSKAPPPPGGSGNGKPDNEDDVVFDKNFSDLVLTASERKELVSLVKKREALLLQLAERRKVTSEQFAEESASIKNRKRSEIINSQYMPGFLGHAASALTGGAIPPALFKMFGIETAMQKGLAGIFLDNDEKKLQRRVNKFNTDKDLHLEETDDKIQKIVKGSTARREKPSTDNVKADSSQAQTTADNKSSSISDLIEPHDTVSILKEILEYVKKLVPGNEKLGNEDSQKTKPVSFFRKMWDGAKALFSGKSILGTFGKGGLFAALTGTLVKLKSGITGALGSVKTGAIKIWDGTKSMLGKAWDVGKGLVNKTKSLGKSIKDGAPKLFKKTPKTLTPKIPTSTTAKAGMFGKTLGKVGTGLQYLQAGLTIYDAGKTTLAAKKSGKDLTELDDILFDKVKSSIKEHTVSVFGKDKAVFDRVIGILGYVDDMYRMSFAMGGKLMGPSVDAAGSLYDDYLHSTMDNRWKRNEEEAIRSLLGRGLIVQLPDGSYQRTTEAQMKMNSVDVDRLRIAPQALNSEGLPSINEITVAANRAQNEKLLNSIHETTNNVSNSTKAANTYNNTYVSVPENPSAYNTGDNIVYNSFIRP